MKTVLLLGGPAAGQRVEVHGNMTSWSVCNSLNSLTTIYRIVPMCSHGEVHWFGVLDGADPLALLIAGYGMNVVPKVESPWTASSPPPAGAQFEVDGKKYQHNGLLPRGTTAAEAMEDFTPTKNREGEAP